MTIKEVADWFDDCRVFMSDNHLLGKSKGVYHADETGFTTGSKNGRVIGPSKKVNANQIPHVSGGEAKKEFL